jgi:hypothetical protein
METCSTCKAPLKIAFDGYDDYVEPCTTEGCADQKFNEFWSFVHETTREVECWPYWRRGDKKPETTMEWIKEYQRQLRGLSNRKAKIEALLEARWAELRKEQEEINSMLAEKNTRD